MVDELTRFEQLYFVIDETAFRAHLKNNFSSRKTV